MSAYPSDYLGDPYSLHPVGPWGCVDRVECQHSGHRSLPFEAGPLTVQAVTDWATRRVRYEVAGGGPVEHSDMSLLVGRLSAPPSA
jgi:hypothetical protein